MSCRPVLIAQAIEPEAALDGFLAFGFSVWSLDRNRIVP